MLADTLSYAIATVLIGSKGARYADGNKFWNPVRQQKADGLR